MESSPTFDELCHDVRVTLNWYATHNINVHEVICSLEVLLPQLLKQLNSMKQQ